MKTKVGHHSPGPWSWVKVAAGDKATGLYDAVGRPILEIATKTAENDRAESSITAADKNLIRASPMLLDACKKAMETFIAVDDDTAEALEVLEQAIESAEPLAKAEPVHE